MTDLSLNRPSEGARPYAAAYFALSLAYAVLLVAGALIGDLGLLLVVLGVTVATAVFDRVLPETLRNADLENPGSSLVWHDRLLALWVVLQLGLIYGAIAYVAWTDRVDTLEAIALMLCVGIGTGTFGVVYAHELMHRRDRWSKALAETLLGTVLYGHFITEHLKIHHPYVGTPRDNVTARYRESLYAFLARAIPGSLASAWRVERNRLRLRGKPLYALANPFWRYAGAGVLAMVLALAIGGWFGLLLFLVQAATAIFLTETINYIQHYGLTRRYLGQGKYERVQAKHSWNAFKPVTSWLLINLQRHSDHHAFPARPYPLLQAYEKGQAPRMPFGYPVMFCAAMVPPLWRRLMDWRVRRWRKQHYPDIEDWSDYNRQSLPPPR
ncbi:MAG: alkane 1-monooxygenase [Pseudomonadota bacterium]